jgi:hypothetical protein
MSAHDALSDTQFVSHKELSSMYSGDFDEPMSNLQHQSMFREQVHPAYADLPKRGSRATAHVNRLARDITKNGMREPITVRGGNVVVDGHHRALAAMKIGLDRVPVKHIR